MQWYKHHLGDYDGSTAHLTWDEDMAYTRLMRAYYRTESPLPLDFQSVCRLVRSTTTKQKNSTRQILSEFFKKEENGWHNKRCDEEILKYQAQSSTNRRIARQRFVNDSSTVGSPNQEPRTKNLEPRTDKELKTKPTKKVNGSAQAPFVLPDWIPEDHWRAWIESRQKARKSPTDYAKRLAVMKLDNLREQGFPPAQVLMQSAFNNWSGLFPVKEIK